MQRAIYARENDGSVGLAVGASAKELLKWHLSSPETVIFLP